MLDPDQAVFELSRAAALANADRSVRQRHAAGELVRVRSGFYLLAEDWAAMPSDNRYRARIHAAAAATRPGTQFSHDSAAALWRLPTLGEWSPRVHALAERASGGRSSTGIRRHGIGLDREPATIGQTTVTSLERTAVDASCTTGFVRAVGMVDAALRAPQADEFRFAIGIPAVSKDELNQLLSGLAPYSGAVRAQRVIDFADPLSASLGESLSRAQFHLLGLPAPQLQVPFHDEAGLIGYVDFYWPELGLVGEFDGQVKYKGKRYLRGRLPEEVVWTEKLREDRLRRVVARFARWDWATALDPRRLAERMRPFGLVRERNTRSR